MDERESRWGAIDHHVELILGQIVVGAGAVVADGNVECACLGGSKEHSKLSSASISSLSSGSARSVNRTAYR